MARKPIPDAVQNSILLKSRRRCCLCFWLEGKDEVQKGQIAHLDQDNENADEDNLCFLCFDHHEDYDGTTRIAKGLREDEVRHWRNELYREMEYRFRTVRKRDFKLSVVRFVICGPEDRFYAKLKLRNTGELAVRSPVITIRLPEGVDGKLPDRRHVSDMGTYTVSTPVFDLYAMEESVEDIFEPNGRVAIQSMGGLNPVLLQGHSWPFDGLVFRGKQHAPGTVIPFEYRVDGEDMTPFMGTFEAAIPATPGEFDIDDDAVFESDDQ